MAKMIELELDQPSGVVSKWFNTDLIVTMERHTDRQTLIRMTDGSFHTVTAPPQEIVKMVADQ